MAGLTPTPGFTTTNLLSESYPPYPTGLPGRYLKSVTEEIQDYSSTEVSSSSPLLHAHTFLESAVSEMKDRAVQRDTKAQGGERSMAATVKAFNALTGHTLSEEEGWEFMILLKLVRGRQGDFRADDYTDTAAYSALLGECASKNRRKPKG